jgi:hypothetical protein
MGQGRRRFRASVEALEVRDLLSPLHVVRSFSSDRARNGPNLNLVVQSQSIRGDAQTSAKQDAAAARAKARQSSGFDPSLIPGFVRALYAPITTTQTFVDNGVVFPPGTYAVPQPNPREVKRQTFLVQFDGRYSVGPARFANQASTIHIFSQGKAVNSNWFLHGRGQILIFPPANPAAQPRPEDPVAGQTIGLVTLFPSNTLQSSGVMFLDLTNLAGTASNDPAVLNHGLPSRLQFTLDTQGAGSFTSPSYTTLPPSPFAPTPGGPQAGAAGFSQGTGIVNLHYFPDNRLRAGATQSGTVKVTIEGVINFSGTLNSLYKGIN